LQSQLPTLEANGIVPFAVSYDAIVTLAAFAAAHGITYPLLSDAGSAFIRALGILNTDVAPENEHYGIPYPGVYFIGADGRVMDKIFHTTHRTRDAVATTLREHFGIAAGDTGVHDRLETDALVAVATLDNASFVRGERVGLRVTIALAPGVHTYGQSLPDGYIPTTLTLQGPDTVEFEPVAYPPTRPFRADWLEEELPAYSGQFTLTTAVTLAEQREDVTLTATLRFQACTDVECFIPEQLTFTLPLRFRLFPD